MRPRATFAAWLLLSAALLTPDLSFSAAHDAAPPDAVAALAAQLKAGGKPLAFVAPDEGYLPDLLRRLKVAEDSQVLVFSRTSLQQGFISPATPRAIYFSDTVSIGYIPGAPLIEMWAVGRDGLVRFYSLKNTRAGAPSVALESDQCDLCHATANPAAPAPMMVSATTAPSGNVLHQDLLTDGRTPIEQRWGGWYVTGRHGAMRHRGNVTADGLGGPGASETLAGQNVTSLAGRFDASRYRRSTSDIVALMTLEHENGFLNLAGAVQALATSGADEAVLDKAVGELADYMLGVEQAPLTATVAGVSGFSRRFEAEGAQDPEGRSLRDFDLRTRLFRYPLSYMIYTPAFDGLPPQAKAKLYRRLVDVLSGRDASPRYSGLSPADRVAALEIVAATKPGLPNYWPAG